MCFLGGAKKLSASCGRSNQAKRYETANARLPGQTLEETGLLLIVTAQAIGCLSPVVPGVIYFGCVSW